VISGLILEAATTTRQASTLSDRMPPRTKKSLDGKARAFAVPERVA